jgi:hypothetical protein
MNAKAWRDLGGLSETLPALSATEPDGATESIGSDDAGVHLGSLRLEVPLTTPDDQIVNQWLDRLDELQPADGTLTK